MGPRRARFHSKGSKEVLILISKSSFKGREITFIPFKNSAVRFSPRPPPPRKIFQFLSSQFLSLYPQYQLGRICRGWTYPAREERGRATRGSLAKTEAKHSEKISAISASFPGTFHWLFYGIYARVS